MADDDPRRRLCEHPARDHRGVSAGVGGADAITVLPFTAARGLPDRLRGAVARNTQLVLLDEAGIAHVADPTSGAGSSEDLTDKLCHAAWTLFQEIEAAGGAVAALEQGTDPEAGGGGTRGARTRAGRKKDALIGASEYPASDVPVLDVPRMTSAGIARRGNLRAAGAGASRGAVREA